MSDDGNNHGVIGAKAVGNWKIMSKEWLSTSQVVDERRLSDHCDMGGVERKERRGREEKESRVASIALRCS